VHGKFACDPIGVVSVDPVPGLTSVLGVVVRLVSRDDELILGARWLVLVTKVHLGTAL